MKSLTLLVALPGLAFALSSAAADAARQQQEMMAKLGLTPAKTDADANAARQAQMERLPGEKTCLYNEAGSTYFIRVPAKSPCPAARPVDQAAKIRPKSPAQR